MTVQTLYDFAKKMNATDYELVVVDRHYEKRKAVTGFVFDNNEYMYVSCINEEKIWDDYENMSLEEAINQNLGERV